MYVRKHQAPKGALRLADLAESDRALVHVRKHRAPKGASRLAVERVVGDGAFKSESIERQKVH